MGAPRGGGLLDLLCCYDTRVLHRGGANSLRRRPVYYFTLKGAGLTPTGNRYAVQPEDIGAWRVGDFASDGGCTKRVDLDARRRSADPGPDDEAGGGVRAEDS